MLTFLRAEYLPRRYRAGVFGVLLLTAFSRSPYVLLHGRFFAEEGTIYFSHMKHAGFWFIARPVGYIYAFCNVATWLATRVPLEQAPLVTAWLSFGVIALLVWAALSLPSELLPNAASRIAAATLLVVGTHAIAPVWLNSTNSQTYLGVIAVLLLFVDVGALSRARFAGIAALLGLAGLSGLYAAALAPLFLIRAVRDPNRRRVVLAGLISLCALAQLVVIQTTVATGEMAQGRLSFRGLGVLTQDVAAKHFSTFVFGTSLASRLYSHSRTFIGLLLFAFCALVVGAILASVLAFVPRREVAVLLGAAFATEEFLVLFGTRGSAGGRYVVVPIAILLLISVHGMATARNNVAAGVGAAFCLAAFVAGCSVFWTAQPSQLRCVHCPQWQQQVRAWRTGRSDRLLIWPYGKARWTLTLPHHQSETADVRREMPSKFPS